MVTKKQTSIEKHSFKISVGVAITVIIFLLVMSFNFATWKADMNADHKEFDDRINHVSNGFYSNQESILALQAIDSDRDVDIALINAKLANIEALLLEIKQDIKDQSN